MKKLFSLILICAATLLFSGCGTAGFSLGMSYNEWGATVTFMGKTPVNVNTPTEPNPISQK